MARTVEQVFTTQSTVTPKTDLISIIQLPHGFYRVVKGEIQHRDMPVYYIYYWDKDTPDGNTRISNCYNTEVVKYIDVTIDEAIKEYGHVFI